MDKRLLKINDPHGKLKDPNNKLRINGTPLNQLKAEEERRQEMMKPRIPIDPTLEKTNPALYQHLLEEQRKLDHSFK